MSIRSSIFEHPTEHITVLVVDLGQPDEATILERAWLSLHLRVLLHLLLQSLAGTERSSSLVRILNIIGSCHVCFGLEDITLLVFKLDGTVGLVLDELPDDF